MQRGRVKWLVMGVDGGSSDQRGHEAGAVGVHGGAQPNKGWIKGAVGELPG